MMAEINTESDFESAFNEYWSQVSGGLSNVLEKVSSAYSAEDFTDAVKSQEIADTLAAEYQYWSQRAVDLARSADLAGLEMKKSAQTALDSAAFKFKQQADALSKEGLDALEKVEASLLSQVNRDLLSKAGDALGKVTDILDIAIKRIKGTDLFLEKGSSGNRCSFTAN